MSNASLTTTTLDVTPGRRIGHRASLVFAALLPTMWGVGAAASLVGGDRLHVIHDLAGAGLTLEAVWLAGIVATWRRPDRATGPALFGTVVLTAVVAGLLSASNLVVAAVLAVQFALVLATHPDRSVVRRFGPTELHPVLLPLALVGAVVLVPYALTEAAQQTAHGPAEAHAAMAHWFDQAWWALTVAGLALASATLPRLRRAAGVAAGACAIVVGIGSVVWPTAASSLGTVTGAAIAAGAVVLLTVAAHGGRRAAAVTSAP